MQKIQALEYGFYYHIYNRGINSCNIFSNSSNYDYFLKLYDKHISPIADTFAWVLMPNHFHFLVKIKEEEEISTPDNFRIYSIPMHKPTTNKTNVTAVYLNVLLKGN